MKRKIKSSQRCSYLQYCYIAEAQDCFGYKTDCPLYMSTNDEEVSETRFHRAMDNLINQTKFRLSKHT